MVIDIDEAMAPLQPGISRFYGGETEGGMVWELSLGWLQNKNLPGANWFAEWQTGYYGAETGNYIATGTGSMSFCNVTQLKNLLDSLGIPWKTVKYAVK